MTVPYATRLRIHLAESRNAGFPFEKAWQLAILEVPRGRDEDGTVSQWPMEFTRQVMREGYLRLGATTDIGALAERDRLWIERYSHGDHSPDYRQCGWGGRVCKSEAREGGWLCESHYEQVKGLKVNANLSGRTPRGGSECVTPGCKVKASAGKLRCDSHTQGKPMAVAA